MLVERIPHEQDLVEQSKRREEFEIEYKTRFGFRPKQLKPNQWFVTTRALARKLPEFEHLNLIKTESETEPYNGRIVVKANQAKKIIITHLFSPLFYYTSSKHQIMRGLGVATLTELIMEKDLLAHFPKYKISSTTYPNPKRKDQLIHRGRKLGKAIPLARAVKLTRRQIVRQYRNNKPLEEIVYCFGKFKVPDTKHTNTKIHPSRENLMLYREGLPLLKIKKRRLPMRVWDKARIKLKR